MHRIYSLSLLLLLCLSAYSQQVQHAIFLGLSLGGDRDDFVEALEDKGFQVEDFDQFRTSLTGHFDGVGSIVEVHVTPQSQIVHQVSVSFVEFETNDIARWMKFRQIRKQLRKKYSAWKHTSEKGLEEWSSPYARISIGTKRLPGNSYKTLYVWWQDRYGWEQLQQEKKSEH